jgi:hypothetical protein
LKFEKKFNKTKKLMKYITKFKINSNLSKEFHIMWEGLTKESAQASFLLGGGLELLPLGAWTAGASSSSPSAHGQRWPRAPPLSAWTTAASAPVSFFSFPAASALMRLQHSG